MDITAKRICVYCGSSNHVNQRYKDTAFTIGQHLAEQGIGLVYGGGNVGLMKAVADGSLSKGGEVIGVIPKSLEDLELAHPNLTRIFVTQGMHERKSMMAQLSDGFIALPGGYGTMEEVMEVITWSQINVHRKPIGLYNMYGFYDGILQWVDHAHREGFIRDAHRQLLCSSNNIVDLLHQMAKVQFVELRSQI